MKLKLKNFKKIVQGYSVNVKNHEEFEILLDLELTISLPQFLGW